MDSVGVAGFAVLALLPAELQQAVVAYLPSLQLVTLAQCSRDWRTVCEPIFRDRCARRGWRLPRRARGALARTMSPWRSLWLSHVCRGCFSDVTSLFPCLDARSCQVALVCAHCTRVDRVLRHLANGVLRLQTVSLIGSELSLPTQRQKGGKSKRRV